MTVLEEMKQALFKVDPNWNVERDTFKVGLILLAALRSAPNVGMIRVITGLDHDFVKTVVDRLRENGVFKDGKIHADWFDPKEGGMAFLLDAMVGAGLLKRAS